jgi:hypothetical protein
MLTNYYIKKVKSFITIFLFIAALTLNSLASNNEGLLVGYAEVNITPELGTSMPGYFSGA